MGARFGISSVPRSASTSGKDLLFIGPNGIYRLAPITTTPHIVRMCNHLPNVDIGHGLIIMAMEGWVVFDHGPGLLD